MGRKNASIFAELPSYVLKKQMRDSTKEQKTELLDLGENEQPVIETSAPITSVEENKVFVADQIAETLTVRTEQPLNTLKIVHPGMLSDTILQEIKRDLVKRGAKKLEAQQLALEKIIHYIDTQIVPHLHNIHTIALGESKDKAHLMVLNFTHIQQKLGNYLAEHIFKYGYFSHLSEISRYFIQKYHECIPDYFNGAGLTGNDAKSHMKGAISHAFCHNFFSKQHRMHVIKREDSATIEALDMHQGIDFMVIDKAAYVHGVAYVFVYLIDAKSYASRYGDNLQISDINWEDHKKADSLLYKKVTEAVQNKIPSTKGKRVSLPFKIEANTAYDRYLSDEKKLEENLFILRKNLENKLQYSREYSYAHLYRNIDQRKMIPTKK